MPPPTGGFLFGFSSYINWITSVSPRRAAAGSRAVGIHRACSNPLCSSFPPHAYTFFVGNSRHSPANGLRQIVDERNYIFSIPLLYFQVTVKRRMLDC
jgi:hypothetical protein